MDKLIKWLENSFAPKLQKITNLTWVVVIKDSVMQLLPFILAGSIFCVGTILNDYIPALPSFLDSLRLDDEQNRPDGLLLDPL